MTPTSHVVPHLASIHFALSFLYFGIIRAAPRGLAPVTRRALLRRRARVGLRRPPHLNRVLHQALPLPPALTSTTPPQTVLLPLWKAYTVRLHLVVHTTKALVRIRALQPHEHQPATIIAASVPALLPRRTTLP